MKYRNYDETSPESIEKYAQGMIGKTFQQLIEEDRAHDTSIIAEPAEDYAVAHENKLRKGGLGELVEEVYFHYSANNDARPDFIEAGVELKVSPYKISDKGKKTAKERLVIDMINYNDIVNEEFDMSRFWNKASCILLVYYLYQKEIGNRLDYHIDYAKLFTPPKEDLAIIQNDYKIIVEKIKAGKAHELSEGDTMYLGACTKAASSSDRRTQPYSDELAKPRAFAFKNSYMTYVLNNYIIPGKVTYESVIKDGGEYSFENQVVSRINEYIGMSQEELCALFNIESKAKNIGSILVFRMLGIKGNNADEFVKAGIVIKTVRISRKGNIKESMSFPTFKFKELIEEDWETSAFYNYLSETKFLFVVYKEKEEGEFYLKGSQFWNIPYTDLENEVKKVWEKTKKVLLDGLKIETRNGRNYNNLPKASENRVSHVRPHARDKNDTYELPDGRYYPKQCFWLNNSYILEQLDDKFKK